MNIQVFRLDVFFVFVFLINENYLMTDCNSSDLDNQVECKIVWSYTSCQRCFVWSLIIVLAVTGTVTSHTGVLYVSNLAIMPVSTGCNHSHLQHGGKQCISLEVGVTHDS